MIAINERVCQFLSGLAEELFSSFLELLRGSLTGVSGSSLELGLLVAFAFGVLRMAKFITGM